MVTLDIVVGELGVVSAANRFENISAWDSDELVVLVDFIFLVDSEIELSIGYILNIRCHSRYFPSNVWNIIINDTHMPS